jgi:rod shape-determining protein MreC
MLSKRMVVIVVVILLAFFNMTILTVTSKRGMSAPSGVEKHIFPVVAPFQKVMIRTIRSMKGVWEDYFYLVTVSKENSELKKALSLAYEKNNRIIEIELFNSRLREFLKFKEKTNSKILAAEVIGKDSSAWFKTIVIDKGIKDGVVKGLPVVVPEGIAGQVIEVAERYSKVLLIIDRNSAVDALVQRTRARGIIKGESTDKCFFEYALRKYDIKNDDIIVSSGLDGVYPKGLLLGKVSEVVRKNSGIFQEVNVTPFVDFEKLEEVLVVLIPPKH